MRALNLLQYTPMLVLGGVFCTPLAGKLEKMARARSRGISIFLDALLIGIFVLSIAFILANDFQPFLYARF